MAREAMDVCLRVTKESNKSRFNSYSVRKIVLIISHFTFRDCRLHFFSDSLSRNSSIHRNCLLISSEQCPINRSLLIISVSVILGRLPYSPLLVLCSFQETPRTALSILVYVPSSLFLIFPVIVQHSAP